MPAYMEGAKWAKGCKGRLGWSSSPLVAVSGPASKLDLPPMFKVDSRDFLAEFSWIAETKKLSL